jgi:hypothetical protein
VKRLIALSLLTLFLILTPAVLAQTPSRVRSASPSSQPAGRADEIKDRIATRVAETRSQTHFVVGKIVTIDRPNLVVNLTGGRSLNVQTDSKTKFFDMTLPTRKTTTLANLRVGERVAVIGLSPADSSGLAKIIMKLPAERLRTTLLGTITKIETATASGRLQAESTSSATVTLRHRSGTSSAILISADTKLKIRSVTSPTVASLKVGQKAVVTGPKGVDPMPASNFHVLGDDPRANREATPSTRPTSRGSTNSGTRR